MELSCPLHAHLCWLLLGSLENHKLWLSLIRLGVHVTIKAVPLWPTVPHLPSCSEEQQVASKMGQRPCECRGYRNNHFASPGRCGFEFWSGLDVFVPLGPLCIGGASCTLPTWLAQGHLSREQGSLANWGAGAQLPGAPGQSLAGIQAVALTQIFVLLGQATWQTQQQQPVRKPAPSHQATGKPIYFMYWDRRISKRLGRFAHFIITVLGHSYTEDCSPSCLWEVPIAPGWVTDTLYHNTAVGKLCTVGDWSQWTDLATSCSLWVTVLNHRA